MLKERMDVLKDAGVINEDVYNYLVSVIDEIACKYEGKDNFLEMFTTHLAMATQRIINQEELECLDPMIWNEIVNHPAFGTANEELEKIISTAPCSFPESEKQFLLMHLCNLNG